MADSLTITIAGKSDALQKEYDKIRDQTENLEKQLKSVAKISAAAFAGLVATAGLAVREFAKFDDSIRAVRTLLDETSFGAKNVEQGFAGMKKELLNVAQQVPVTFDSLSKSLFDVVSAGVDASKAVETVGVAGKLAVAGITDIAIATDGLTSALNAYRIDASKSEVVASKFFLAQKRGKTTVEDLSRGFGLVSSSAASLGVSLDELLGAVSAATVGSIRTNQAYTGLAAILSNIAKPTAEAREEAARLGLDFSLSALRAKGFQGFLESLTTAQGFTTESATKLFGSLEAQKVAFSLTGAQADIFKKIVGELGNETDALTTFQEAYKTQSDSLSNQLKLLGNQFRTVAIAVGAELAPLVIQATKGFSFLFQVMNNNPALTSFIAKALVAGIAVTGIVTGVTTLAIAFIQLRAAMIAAQVASLALTVALRTALITTGIGAVIVVLSLLVSNWEDVTTTMSVTWTRMVAEVKATAAGLATVLRGIATRNLEVVKDGFRQIDEAREVGIRAGAEKAIQLQEEAAAREKEKKLELQRKLAEDLKNAKDAIDDKNRNDDAAKGIVDDETRRLQAEQRLLKELDTLTKDDEVLTAARGELTRKEQLDLASHLDTQESKRKAAAALALKNQIKLHNDFEANEREFAKALFEIDEVLASGRVTAMKGLFGELAQMQSSSNSTLKAIGKAGAIGQITIDTAQSSSNIAKWIMQTIPWPFSIPLAVTAVAGRVAFGAEQIAKVVSAQQGGFVPLAPGGTSFRDSSFLFAQPGEFVTPRNSADEVINSVANARAMALQDLRDREESYGNGGGKMEVVVGFDGDEASRVLSIRRQEEQRLGIFTGA